MNIEKWKTIYDNNKRLDSLFYEKYKDDKDLFIKNCIELLVEIGEFTNETKMFKYWSSKQMNREKALEEYADVLTMILTFYGELNLEIKEPKKIFNNNVLEVIIELYQESAKLVNKFNSSLLENIFSYAMHIGNLLDFKEAEVFCAIENKQIIIENRLNMDY